MAAAVSSQEDSIARMRTNFRVARASRLYEVIERCAHRPWMKPGAEIQKAGSLPDASLCRGLSGDELRQLQGTLVFELGAYVGETFIRNHGGCWGWATMPGNRSFGLRTGSGLTAFPLTKAKKRLLGNFGSLVAFYRLLVRWPELG